MSDVPAALQTGTEQTGADVVTVVLPARSAYVAVLRSTAAALAARQDFTLDEIDDMRIGVDEACALLLAQAAEDAQLRARFRLLDKALEVTVSVRASSSPRIPARDSFSWTVLTALAGPVEVQVGAEDQLTVALTKHAGAR